MPKGVRSRRGPIRLAKALATCFPHCVKRLANRKRIFSERLRYGQTTHPQTMANQYSQPRQSENNAILHFTLFFPSPLSPRGRGARGEGESDYLHSIFRQTVKEPFVANHKLFIRVCTDQRIVLDHRNNAFPLTHPFEMLHSPPHPQPLSHEGRGEPENLGS